MNIFFVDQGYNLCSSLYPTGKDSCYNCSIGTFNDIPVNTAEITYSYQEELCRKIDCDCAPGETKKKKRERLFSPPELKAQESFSIQNLSIVVVVIKFSQFYLLLKNHSANFKGNF